MKNGWPSGLPALTEEVLQYAIVISVFGNKISQKNPIFAFFNDSPQPLLVSRGEYGTLACRVLFPSSLPENDLWPLFGR
jgi:hypothetical protein